MKLYAVTWHYNDEADRVFDDRAAAIAWAMNEPETVTFVEIDTVAGTCRDITAGLFPAQDDDVDEGKPLPSDHPDELRRWHEAQVL